MRFITNGGALREATCGIPYFKIPDRLPKAVYNYAPAEGVAFMEANAGKTLEEADPDTSEAVREQMETAAKILEERGVVVHRPERACGCPKLGRGR